MTTQPVRHGIPEDILALSHERDELRKRGQYDRADALKKRIEEAGYGIKDNPRGAHLIILPSVEVNNTFYRVARQVPSLLNEPDTCLFSVVILAKNQLEEVRRCVESVLRHVGDQAIEVIVIDNASQDELATWVRNRQKAVAFLHLIRVSRPMGEAEALNLGLKQSRGCYILQLDPALELTGDLIMPLASLLDRKGIGLTGLHGLRTDNLRHFEERSDAGPEIDAEESAEVEAITGTCLAFRRDLLRQTGLLDEGYRFPFYLDIDFSFAIRDTGAKAIVARNLPVSYHPARSLIELSDAERSRLTRRNFYRFLDKWGGREDLLLEGYEQDEEDFGKE